MNVVENNFTRIGMKYIKMNEGGLFMHVTNLYESKKSVVSMEFLLPGMSRLKNIWNTY